MSTEMPLSELLLPVGFGWLILYIFSVGVLGVGLLSALISVLAGGVIGLLLGLGAGKVLWDVTYTME